MEINCQRDWELTFAYPVTNLVFVAAFFDSIDAVVVEAFFGATSLGTVNVNADGTYSFGATSLGTVNVNADGTYSFGGAVITSLFFDDSSTGAGFGFGDFRFDRAAVPEPGALALFGAGLAVLAWRRRRF